MKKGIREALGYNKSERRGITTLLFMVSIAILLNVTMPSLLRPFQNRLDEKQLIHLKSLLDKKKILTSSTVNNTTPGKEVKYIPFDPNIASASELETAGLTGKQARTIINFRNKGGQFRIKSDLKKIYSVSESDYLRFEPYILLPDGLRPVNETTASARIADTRDPIEINAADSADLTELKGIGPVFASRIIKYRNLLGGYVNRDQLLEIYGMKPEYYESFKDQIKIETLNIISIDLKNDEFKALLRHPYLDYETTKTIFKLRKIDSLNSSTAIFRYLHVHIDSNLIKLQPYIEME